MALFFGLYYEAFFLLRGLLFGQHFQIVSMLFQLGLWVLSFFLWFNLVTAPLWNRRARRQNVPTMSSEFAGQEAISTRNHEQGEEG
jgi:hypothetical protein